MTSQDKLFTDQQNQTVRFSADSGERRENINAIEKTDTFGGWLCDFLSFDGRVGKCFRHGLPVIILF